MTENKAKKALKKVIINLTPRRYDKAPVLKVDEVAVKIDISDKLAEGEEYYLESIEVEKGAYGRTIHYIPYARIEHFKDAVGHILDATIVNAKQRKSAQILLENAFYNYPESYYDSVL